MNALQPVTSADVLHEVRFSTSRSSGPGGQNVNKVNSRVSLHWEVSRSRVLTDDQLKLISHKLANYLTREGELILRAQESRSQLQNKNAVIQKLDLLLKRAFAAQKPRRKTRPTGASKARRRDSKKRLSEKKQSRKKFD